MNIVLLNFDSVVNSFGGTARVFANMANELVAKGHNVTGLTYELADGAPAFEIDKRVHLKNCCSGLAEKIFHNENLAKLRTFYIRDRKARRIKRIKIELTSRSSAIEKALQEAKPDVIVAFQQPATYLLVEILKVKQPVVTMIHNKPTYYFERPEFEIFKPALDKCAGVQVLMPQYVNEAKQFLNQTNIVYIPNVVPQYPNVTELRKPVILNVAKIANRKRQHLIVEAFAKIAEKSPEWSVELWGFDKTEYAQKLKDQIRALGLESRVKLCGETKQITQKLQQASIFAFPSAFEGFSLAFTEAMSMGLPVIGCEDCTAVSSLISDHVNGLVSAPNADDLAQKLTYLIENPKIRESMGNEAKIAMREFSPQAVWAKWDDLLKSLGSN